MAVGAFTSSVPAEEIAASAAEVDREARFPRDAVDALAASGLLGIGLPEDLGGAGSAAPQVVEAVVQVAGACASTGMVFVMHIVAAQTLLAGTPAGDDGPKAHALAAIARGEHLSTLAYSERGSRGHFWAQVSRARDDGDGVVVDADKSWATSAGEADSYVMAMGAPGGDDPLHTELYLVDAAADGIEITSRFDGLGMRGNASAPLRVRGLRVSTDRRLGEPGSGFPLMMQATLPWFALGSAGVQRRHRGRRDYGGHRARRGRALRASGLDAGGRSRCARAPGAGQGAPDGDACARARGRGPGRGRRS